MLPGRHYSLSVYGRQPTLPALRWDRVRAVLDGTGPASMGAGPVLYLLGLLLAAAIAELFDIG
jgi:hypothetical protein